MTLRFRFWILLAILFVICSAEIDEDRTGLARMPGAKRRHQNIRDNVQFVQKPNGIRRRRPIKPEYTSLKPPQTTTVERDGRFLSLFTVVKFQNQVCQASSGDNGTCLTGSECQERGGVSSGTCANGYGVCCVFLASCGQTTRENCTYFVNPGYPTSYDGTSSCQLTINKAHENICQFRFDFDQFNIGGPEPINNVCSNDQFIVSGGSPIPAICGVNNGNHMYIDAGMGPTNPVTLTFVTSGPSFGRNWKVKVCQIPCDTTYRAEDGCLQYYTGVAGQIKSFNYEPAAGLQLSNQDYSICIRTEKNFCGIQYTQCVDAGIDPVNNRSRSFSLSGNANTQTSSGIGAGIGVNTCNQDWLLIPCASNMGRVNSTTCVDRICGQTFNSELSSNPATVYSMVKPFRLYFHTNNVEAPSDVANRGFCLNYVQQPCTNTLV